MAQLTISRQSISCGIWMRKKIWIKATMRHAQIFLQKKLLMTRTITCSKLKNEITIEDKIENIGAECTPVMLLYHMNMGYPMLSEDAELCIPAAEVLPATSMQQRTLTPGTRCSPRRQALRSSAITTSSKGKPGMAAIYNHARGYGLQIQFDSSSLDCFTQWKMMGYKDYVMGLEPGNCYPDGRDVMRSTGPAQIPRAGRKQVLRCASDHDRKNDDQWQTILNQAK